MGRFLKAPAMDPHLTPPHTASAPMGASHRLGATEPFGGPQLEGGGVADACGSACGEAASALWRQAVHDLRGRLGVISNVTALLQRPASDATRAELMAVLDRNVGGLRDLLDGVAELARLDARQERPVIHSTDVAAVLDDSCHSLRALAASRGLSLEVRGPASLHAESDVLMVSRIAQNLLLNAIRYTRSSGVILSCGTCDDTPADSWYFDIGDAPCNVAGNDRSPSGRAPGLLPDADADADALAAVAAVVSAPGEGIGLSIVGRLCGLLGATMEVRQVGAGRSTRIQLPQRYGGVIESQAVAAADRSRAACPTACVDADLLNGQAWQQASALTAASVMHS